MSKPNSGPTNRNFGLNHTNGKGSKSRITDVTAYRDNFDEINWSSPPRIALRPEERLIPIIYKREKTLREIEEEFAWRMGL